VAFRRVSPAGSSVRPKPIRHLSNRSDNAHHRASPLGGVGASTSGAPQGIKRPTRNHNRFIGLNFFLDRLLEPIQEVWIQEQGFDLDNRRSMIWIMARRMKAATVLP
jgi:hypothetical protein